MAWAAKPDILHTHHELIVGDARTMPELVEGSAVHLIVTSPPYWTLKEYDRGAGADQLGHLESYDAFIDELDRVWKRCFDVLTPGGRLCVVVGDVCLPRKKAKRHHVVPLHANISVRCRRIGFDYLSPIFWHKIANAATEVAGNGASFLGKPYEPNGIIKNDVEYILMFRKPGAYRRPTQLQRDLSMIDRENHSKWFRQIWADVPGSSRYLGHPAPFPVELARRLVGMFSFVGDNVLDPFVGTGTTSIAALRSHRGSVGYDIESRYIELATSRLLAEAEGIEATVSPSTNLGGDPQLRLMLKK